MFTDCAIHLLLRGFVVLVQETFSKQLLRTSFRRSAVGTPRTSGNGELIHLMQSDGFL
jgi:hypothetical protein